MNPDQKAWLQLGLAIVGFGALLGSVTGAAWGYARTALCWCCTEDEEPA